ncbi:hypothetical protein [Streptomyces flavofungini]|uniref:hypothetical protein n=1 Tax=Streptomyces flavofungini TaxID=68200 RepID=UPI0034DE2F2F
MRKWRSAVVTAAWVAVGTAAGALGAWQLASADGGDGAAHSRPLDEAAVRAALARASASGAASGDAATGGTGAPSASGGASPRPAGEPSEPQRPSKPQQPQQPQQPSRPKQPSEPTGTPERSTVRFTGGSATVECRPDGTVRLVSWSPADGFHIDDDVVRGPAAVARLEAEPGDDEQDDLPYEIRCTADGPRARVVPDADDD